MTAGGGPAPVLPDDAFDPGARAAREAGTAAAWRAHGEELTPHAWRVPLLLPSAASALLSEVDARRAVHAAAGGPAAPPNSMHEHGAVLAPLGFGPLLDALLADWVRPLATHLFADFGGAELDGHHGYLVEYGRDADTELGFHVDDSEVTLNLCLGDEPFDGAELTLLGLRCELHRQTPVGPDEVVEVEHRVGTAILHAGAHRHRVEPIRRGRRRNLILWCRASSRRTGVRRLVCPPWCGR